MHASILLSLYGLAAYVLYSVLSSIATRIRHASKERELGTAPIPMVPDTGFLGTKNLQTIIGEDKKGTLLQFALWRYEHMSRLHGRPTGTYGIKLFGNRMVFTADPKNLQAMLATQFQDFDLGEVRYQIMAKVLGDGIFVQDGKKWEHSRALLRPNFVREQIADIALEEAHLQEMLQVMPVQKDGWTSFTNIQTLFFRLTIDTSTEFLFGESCSSQLGEATAAPNGKKDNFSQAFDSAQLVMATKFRFNTLHWLYRPKGYEEDIQTVNNFVDKYVNRALHGSSQGKDASSGHKQKYVFLEALVEQTRDPIELRSQLLNILLAGRDTTASLLSWTFDQLLRNPAVFDKLRAAVIETFGTFDDPQDISFASLKSCQYLQHTLNESLRLWTVVPSNGRRANKDTTLPRGGGPDGQSPIFIPKGTQVEYSIHVMHNRKDIWGEDAAEFKPERWQGRRPGWEFLPFNGGPRICIGQQFALTEASYVLVRLLQRFDRIEPAPGQLDGPVKSTLTLTSAPGQPVTLRLHQASA